MVGVGAAFDFITGRVRRAPAWVRENGLEWLFRFLVVASLPCSEFAWNVSLELLGLRKFE